MIVHDNAAIDGNPGIAGDGYRRADAHCHHHQIGGDRGPVLEQHPLGALGPQDLRGVGSGQDRLPARFERLFEQPPRSLVELALHQRGHQVDDGNLHPPQAETMRCLEPQQAPADHHRRPAVFGRLEHRLDIVHVAKPDHPGQVLARHRDDERVRSRGDHQPVVPGGQAAAGGDGLLAAIDRRHRIARDQRDAVFVVPIVAVDHDLGKALFAREHRREHDPVVVDPRLGPEDRYPIAARIARQQFLDRTAPRHAVADHHEVLTRIALAAGDRAKFHRARFAPFGRRSRCCARCV